MLRRVLLIGIFVGLASAGTLAATPKPTPAATAKPTAAPAKTAAPVPGGIEVKIVTSNPDSAYITSIDANNFGYAAYPGPTFQLNDSKGKPWPGETLTFSCSGPAFYCPPMLNKTAKTDQLGRASLQFTGDFKAAIPPAPPGRGAIVGTYKMAANWGQCSPVPGGGCVHSQDVVFNVLCNGPFTQCVGLPPKATPAPTAAPTPKSSSRPSTSKATLSVTDTTPISVALTKNCRGKNCDYSFSAIAHVKLVDGSGKPVKGAEVNIDFGKLAGSPFSSGTTANTDANGIATLQTDFQYSSQANPPPLGAGSKITGHVTVSGAPYAGLKLDVPFTLH